MVLRRGLQRTLETEGIEKGHQQQEAHHAEDDGNDDNVNGYVIIARGKVGETGRGYGGIFHFVDWNAGAWINSTRYGGS